MPKMKCKDKGKEGMKYGSTGKCYTGRDKEEKMNTQRKAIKASQSKKKGK